MFGVLDMPMMIEPCLPSDTCALEPTRTLETTPDGCVHMHVWMDGWMDGGMHDLCIRVCMCGRAFTQVIIRMCVLTY